jgi:hypothetical protein
VLKVQCIVSLSGSIEVLQKHYLVIIVQPNPRILVRAIPQLISVAGFHERIRHFARLCLNELFGIVILYNFIIPCRISHCETLFRRVNCRRLFARGKATIDAAYSIEPYLGLAVLVQVPRICHVLVLRLELLPD